MSQIWADYIAKKTGARGDTFEAVADDILKRRDSASVSMMKEIRDATEGSKTTVSVKPMLEIALKDVLSEEEIKDIVKSIKTDE